MWKKMSVALLLTVATVFTGLNADGVEQLNKASSLDNASMSARHGKHERRCNEEKRDTYGSTTVIYPPQQQQQQQQNGNSWGCHKSDCGPQLAYFFLRPSDLDDSESSRIIESGDPIIWDSEVFTIKSPEINVKVGALNPSGHDEDILIGSGGIYLISYTVFANAFEDVSDAYTMALFINDSEVAGSRFTNTFAYVTSGAENNLQDASQLFGHVIAYVPSGANLELRNVSRFSIRLENEEGQDGVVASIALQKLADSI